MKVVPPYTNTVREDGPNRHAPGSKNGHQTLCGWADACVTCHRDDKPVDCPECFAIVRDVLSWVKHGK